MVSRTAKTLLIADDHLLIRQALSQRFQELGYEVLASVSSAEEALAEAKICQPSIVVLDLAMPGDVLETLGQLTQLTPRPRILILTAHEEDETAVRFLRAGADGYLRKTSAGADLEHALRQLSQGRKYLSPELAALVATTPAEQEQTAARLSPRESQVLDLIVAGESVSEIASQLSLSVKTVSTYRLRLLEKLDLSNNAELIRYAMDSSHR